MIFRWWFKHLLLLSLVTLISSYSQAVESDQQTKVLLRKVGHEFLLKMGDSTSRILPIENVNGRYLVQFERMLFFEPDLIMSATFEVLEQFQVKNDYIIEVEKCGSKEVVHSFQTTLIDSSRMIACQQRQLPMDCYAFYFTKIEETTDEYSQIYILGMIILMLILGMIFYLKRRSEISNETQNSVKIGDFQFNPKSLLLVHASRSVELSNKESDLLYLLFLNKNKTLKREYILSIVWEDDGDYVGRTLDMFISKLRKKLEADPKIKIINIRGLGYRFVID